MDEVIKDMMEHCCHMFNIQPSDQVKQWTAEACQLASSYPDKIYALKDSKSMEDSTMWLIFLYRVEQYVGIKNASFNENDQKKAIYIRERFEKIIKQLEARLSIWMNG